MGVLADIVVLKLMTGAKRKPVVDVFVKWGCPWGVAVRIVHDLFVAGQRTTSILPQVARNPQLRMDLLEVRVLLEA